MKRERVNKCYLSRTPFVRVDATNPQLPALTDEPSALSPNSLSSPCVTNFSRVGHTRVQIPHAHARAHAHTLGHFRKTTLLLVPFDSLALAEGDQSDELDSACTRKKDWENFQDSTVDGVTIFFMTSDKQQRK